jgi:hypothetical protein
MIAVMEQRDDPPQPSADAKQAQRILAIDHAIAGSRVNMVGMAVCFGTLILPAFLIWGIRPALLPQLMEPGVLLALSAVTAVVGAIWCAGRAPLWLGAMAAAIATPGALFVLSWWIETRTRIILLRGAARAARRSVARNRAVRRDQTTALMAR